MCRIMAVLRMEGLERLPPAYSQGQKILPRQRVWESPPALPALCKMGQEESISRGNVAPVE